MIHANKWRSHITREQRDLSTPPRVQQRVLQRLLPNVSREVKFYNSLLAVLKLPCYCNMNKWSLKSFPSAMLVLWKKKLCCYRLSESFIYLLPTFLSSDLVFCKEDSLSSSQENEVCRTFWWRNPWRFSWSLNLASAVKFHILPQDGTRLVFPLHLSPPPSS